MLVIFWTVVVVFARVACWVAGAVVGAVAADRLARWFEDVTY